MWNSCKSLLPLEVVNSKVPTIEQQAGIQWHSDDIYIYWYWYITKEQTVFQTKFFPKLAVAIQFFSHRAPHPWFVFWHRWVTLFHHVTTKHSALIVGEIIQEKPASTFTAEGFCQHTWDISGVWIDGSMDGLWSLNVIEGAAPTVFFYWDLTESSNPANNMICVIFS